jgi:hypothetical protein
MSKRRFTGVVKHVGTADGGAGDMVTVSLRARARGEANATLRLPDGDDWLNQVTYGAEMLVSVHPASDLDDELELATVSEKYDKLVDLIRREGGAFRRNPTVAILVPYTEGETRG